MCVCLTLGSYLIKKPVGKSLRTALIGRKHGFDSINRHSCTLHYFAATHAPLGSSSLPATRVPAPSAPATEQESPSFAHSILSPGTPLHTLGQEVKITCQGASERAEAAAPACSASCSLEPCVCTVVPTPQQLPLKCPPSGPGPYQAVGCLSLTAPAPWLYCTASPAFGRRPQRQ